MSDLDLVTATLGWSGSGDCIRSWNALAASRRRHVTLGGYPMLEAYQKGLEGTQAPVVGFVHDDAVVDEAGWDERVLAEFENPEVGVVGFAGALGHGALDMYRKPFEVVSLARRGFRSNLREAEKHGERFAGACDVAVLDGCVLFVRRVLLEGIFQLGLKMMQDFGDEVIIPLQDGEYGWPKPETKVDYLCYDYWICCRARELGYRIRLVGVAFHHYSGMSTGLNPNLVTDWEGAHRYIYDRFREVLPYTVP